MVMNPLELEATLKDEEPVGESSVSIEGRLRYKGEKVRDRMNGFAYASLHTKTYLKFRSG